MKKLILLALLFSTSAMAVTKTEIFKVMDAVVVAPGTLAAEAILTNKLSKPISLARADKLMIQIETTAGVTGAVIPQASLDCVNFFDVTSAQAAFTGPIDVLALSTLSWVCARVKIVNNGASDFTATVYAAVKGDK